MKIGINVNLNRDIYAKASSTFCAKLKKNGIEYKVCDNAAAYFSPKEISSLAEVFEWCDIVVAFGGDGTMLDTVRKMHKNLPILGINMGKIGFLTELDESELDFAVECLKNQKFVIENRTLLKTCIDSKEYFALNEIIVNQQDPCHISVFDITIDGIKSDSLRSDGVLVSTPTGSTAYSLSCNGPVLSPTVKALIINAICPHSLHSCPIVVDDDMKITISTKGENIRVIADGEVVAKDKNGLQITIEKAQKNALFIRLKNENFYVKLRKKLNYWGN